MIGDLLTVWIWVECLNTCVRLSWLCMDLFSTLFPISKKIVIILGFYNFFLPVWSWSPLPYRKRGWVLSIGMQCALNWLELVGSGEDIRMYIWQEVIAWIAWKVVTVFKLFPLRVCCMDKMGTVIDSLFEANAGRIRYSCQQPTNYLCFIETPEVPFSLCGLSSLETWSWRSSCKCWTLLQQPELHRRPEQRSKALFANLGMSGT